MKQSLYLLLIFVFGFTCPVKDLTRTEKYNTTGDGQTNWIYPDKLSVTGDFDGDGKTDTLVQNIVSKLSGRSIDSIPDFNDWDSLLQFSEKAGAEVILTLLNGKSDTLYMGNALGLFCLINMGDNNNDKRDEIAVVVDYCDYSNCNSCLVYTLCENKWVMLMSFAILETAFAYEGDTLPAGNEIEGFLEHRENQWMYIDYNKWFEAKKAKDTIMQPLRLKKGC